jgi:hypothetical protein
MQDLYADITMGVKKDKLLSSHKARSERIRESLNRLAAGLKKTFHDQEVGGFFTAPEPNQKKNGRNKRKKTAGKTQQDHK